MQILITEPAGYSQAALNIYARAGSVVLLPNTGLALEEAIVNADVVVIKLRYPLHKALLQKAEKLRYIISPTTGLDHIDEAFAKEKGIQIISLRGEIEFLSAIPSTAEFTWTLLMTLFKRIVPAVAHTRQGQWDRNQLIGNNLQGKKLGILGLGRVGTQMAGFARAFGMQVMAFDPYKDLFSWPENVAWATTAIELAQWAEVFSIHIPVVGNEGFVSAEILNELKPGTLLLNTSRGSVWDETAVADLLKNGILGGVGTDVLAGELDKNNLLASPLLALAPNIDNLIITPHIAGATRESMAATEDFVAEKFERIIG